MKNSELKAKIEKINKLFHSGNSDTAIELLKTLDNLEIYNGIEPPVTHDITLKNKSDIWGTSIEVEPSCAFNEICLDDLIDEIENFKEPFLTYFQTDGIEYELHFVKWTGKNLYHVSREYITDFDKLEDIEDGSDKYFDIISDLENGNLDNNLFPNHEEYEIIN